MNIVNPTANVFTIENRTLNFVLVTNSLFRRPRTFYVWYQLSQPDDEIGMESKNNELYYAFVFQEVTEVR